MLRNLDEHRLVLWIVAIIDKSKRVAEERGNLQDCSAPSRELFSVSQSASLHQRLGSAMIAESCLHVGIGALPSGS